MVPNPEKPIEDEIYFFNQVIRSAVLRDPLKEEHAFGKLF